MFRKITTTHTGAQYVAGSNQSTCFTGRTGDCHNDSHRCSQRRHSPHRDHRRDPVHKCYFSILLMVLIHQYTGLLTGAHIQTSICKCRDASVLGLGVRPLAIWINYVMSCTHSIWMDLDRKDLYRNLPSHDNIWASSKLNKNTIFSRSHKCSNSGNLSINLS